MDHLNLNSDEAIIHTTQMIIINGVRHEAVLTSRRLILVESETGQIHEDILFTDIDLAKSGVNKLREPVITLIFSSPEGESRTLDLIFIHVMGSQNSKDIEKCLSILKQHTVPVESKIPLAGDAIRQGRGEKANTGVLAIDEKTNRPAVPEWSFMRTSHQVTQPIDEETPERSPLFLIGVIVVIFAVLVSGLFVVGQVIHARNVPVQPNAAVSPVTTVVATSPGTIPTESPVSQATLVQVETPVPITIPASGIWVRVEYPGNFSGTIGAHGRNIDVSGSGIKYYQLPVADTDLDGSIAKLDGTADKMVVEVYKDGMLVSRKSTKAPFGLIEQLGTGTEAITNDAVMTLVMTPVSIQNSQTIEDYLPGISVPSTGIWVRAYYPGNFSGTVGGRGLFTPVKSTGDQLYSIPANVGIVEGSFEKDDGSVGKMVVEVYKNGVRISRAVTAIPHGLIDIHTPL